jgi:hypothetical protein
MVGMATISQTQYLTRGLYIVNCERSITLVTKGNKLKLYLFVEIVEFCQYKSIDRPRMSICQSSES